MWLVQDEYSELNSYIFCTTTSFALEALDNHFMVDFGHAMVLLTIPFSECRMAVVGLAAASAGTGPA